MHINNVYKDNRGRRLLTPHNLDASTQLYEYYSQTLTSELSPYTGYRLTYSRFSLLHTECSPGPLAQRGIYADLPWAHVHGIL